MEAIHSSEPSVYTISTLHHIPEDDILHSHRCKKLKSYIHHSNLKKGIIKKDRNEDSDGISKFPE
jgi:hypothetical protein